VRYANLTIFVDEHPDPSLGYVISSLLYKHADDEEPARSGPSGEADTLAEAKQVAKKIAAAAKRRGVADVEVLVQGSASRPTAADFLPGTRVMFRHNGHDFVGRVMGDDNGNVLRVQVQEDNGSRWIVEAHQVKRLDGGHGGGFGATTMRPVSELLSEGFDAGNYANAYDSTDLDDFEDKLEGRAPAYVGGFVLGFYSSYAPHEINDDRYDDARRKYGRLARQHGFID